MGYAAALAAVTLVSLFIGFVVGRINLANASMLYLFAVLATAVIFGRGPAVFAAIAAFLTFDWFFVQPLHQFTVSDPEEWISLLLFMLTATITGQLAAGQRERRREAEEREREAVVLYDVVRLMSESRLEDAWRPSPSDSALSSTSPPWPSNSGGRPASSSASAPATQTASTRSTARQRRRTCCTLAARRHPTSTRPLAAGCASCLRCAQRQSLEIRQRSALYR